MLEAPAMETLIYTMIRDADWSEARRLGSYRGSAEDARDGFLHFSTAAQLRASAAKHRARARDLWLVAVRSADLGVTLRWEEATSRPGLFPHLYGPLPLSAVAWSGPLPLGADGRHVFPEEIP